MLKKNVVLGSVASLALVAATAAFAQSPPQYPNHSLPWEYARTARLNARQAAMPGIIASKIMVAPGTMVVVASNRSAMAVIAYNRALAAQQRAAQLAADQQTQYQQQLNDYQQRLADYNVRMAALQSSAVVASTPEVSGTGNGSTPAPAESGTNNGSTSAPAESGTNNGSTSAPAVSRNQ